MTNANKVWQQAHPYAYIVETSLCETSSCQYSIQLLPENKLWSTIIRSVYDIYSLYIVSIEHQQQRKKIMIIILESFLHRTAANDGEDTTVNASFPKALATWILIGSKWLIHHPWLLDNSTTTLGRILFHFWGLFIVESSTTCVHAFCNLWGNGAFFSPVVHVFGKRSWFVHVFCWDCHDAGGATAVLLA